MAQFVALSGDENGHHVAEDIQGRLTVHGLLTATLPTVIGGRLNLIARTMELDFLRPVYSGDHISCSVVVADVVLRDYGTKLRVEFGAENQHGTKVSGVNMGPLQGED